MRSTVQGGGKRRSVIVVIAVAIRSAFATGFVGSTYFLHWFSIEARIALLSSKKEVRKKTSTFLRRIFVELFYIVINPDRGMNDIVVSQSGEFTPINFHEPALIRKPFIISRRGKSR